MSEQNIFLAQGRFPEYSTVTLTERGQEMFENRARLMRVFYE